MAMSANEMNALVKETAVKAIGLAGVDGATQIDDFTYAIEVETEEGPRYAKVAITATLAKDTKTNKAFDLNRAVELYDIKVAERDAKAAEKAKAKADKLAAAEAKKAAKEKAE